MPLFARTGGISENRLEEKINSIIQNTLVIKGEFETYSEMVEQCANPEVGWVVVVDNDESLEGVQKSFWIYNGTEWLPTDINLKNIVDGGTV